ncbi:MAG: hypothetical protein OEO21_11190, partial [Candidatus Krumholzibacteria bacterium]|nr:hypothetical protein [Candidatus Krumholzibacteria bacterium]
PLCGYSQVIALKVTAEIALRKADSEAALIALQEMKRYGVPFGAMFDIEYREALARAYRMANRLEDAAEVHREMVRLYGGHALSHYDLGSIYEEMGRPADAAQAYTTFLDAWARADDGLPQVEDAKDRLAALRQTIR